MDLIKITVAAEIPQFPAGPARNRGGRCVCWPGTGRFKRKIGWRWLELKDFNALRTTSSMKRIPENQVASFPEATRTCHEKTRCHFEGTL